jgi:5-methylcytosine-specific restriction endonuclease McrA
LTRRPDHIPARKAIPLPVRRAVRARSGGVCERSWCDSPARDLDHNIPQALGGPDTVENIIHLCGGCHAEKTKADVKAIAKADRQGARSGQQARRAKGKTAKIQSPGFDKTLKRTIPSKNKPSRTVRRDT